MEISLIYKVEGTLKIEKVNASKIGEYYKIESVPAFANNLAYGDIVSVEKDGEELFFDCLIKMSGNSVLHIVIFKNIADEIIENLKKLGTNVNIVARNYLVLDVPKSTKYKILKKYLDQMSEEQVLDYKEACIRNVHKISKG